MTARPTPHFVCTLVLLIALVSAAVLLAGCGGGGDDQADDSGCSRPAPTSPGVSTIPAPPCRSNTH